MLTPPAPALLARARLPRFLLPVLLAAAGGAEAAGYYASGWYREAAAALLYDDNLGRTGNPAWRAEDFSTRLGAALGYQGRPRADTILDVAVRADWERYQSWSDLDNLEIALDAVAVFQPVPGYTRPWYEAWMRAARLHYRDSDIRSGWVIGGGAGAGRRFTERLSGRAGYAYSLRRGGGEVFDLENHALEGALDFRVHRRAVVYGTYAFNAGEVVSTGWAYPLIMDGAEASARDDAFGAGTGPGCVMRNCAWRLDAHRHELAGGLELELPAGAVLDVSARWFRVDWYREGRYEGLTWRAALYFRF